MRSPHDHSQLPVPVRIAVSLTLFCERSVFSGERGVSRRTAAHNALLAYLTRTQNYLVPSKFAYCDGELQNHKLRMVRHAT
ncbi:hypothetical protein EVAR_26812_1 [Eumeta japonica]|uniref:Uncharacterized protein n=1 Tax=Eumeta variegata TaxID=151549 RepID=A0A4C1WG26_EUMVA|nr:hypothetical protein EVAR_26812_1 [Eumeta japonica]